MSILLGLRPVTLVATALVTLLLSVQSQATTITYDATHLSGNSWRYDYEISNDSLGAPLEEFTIFFELSIFDQLQSLIAPTGWDGLIAQPDPNLPDNGFIDFLALNGGVAVGEALSGFSVVFDWLTIGDPASQAFDIINLDPFATIDSGFTVRRAPPPPPPPVSVSEPAALAIFGLALLAVVALRYRMQRRSPRHSRNLR